jgi:hypothetical protein
LNKFASATAAILFAAIGSNVCIGQTHVSLQPARPLQCSDSSTNCRDLDAIVFVHGIYGSDNTFRNPLTGFDWPARFPTCIQVGPDCRKIDVFRLDYQTALLSWARGTNPSFESIATAMLDAMKPLRKRQYRSIGFIAHSLGGNVVSTYIHMTTSKFGHPQRSQNAFVITLATPVIGSQVADVASVLKDDLGMHDALLDSLKKDNLYLAMLNEFRSLEVEKEGRYDCRPVHLHAAYEKKYIGPLLIVTPDSAAVSISEMVNSPVIGFELNHIEIAKPPSDQAPVYKWTMGLVRGEYIRLATWDDAHKSLPPEHRMCERMAFLPEP